MDNAYEHRWIFEPVQKPKVTNQVIDDIYKEASEKYGTTLKKLSENE